MLKQRIITALWLIPLVLAGIFLLAPAYLAWALVPVFLIAAKEWGRIIDPDCSVTQWSFTITIGILLATINYVVPAADIWDHNRLHPVYQGILGLGAIWWLLATVLVVIYPKAKSTWAQSPMLKSMFGQLTLVPCFSALMALESLGFGRDPYFGGTLVLLVMLTVWAADTGAYFAGKAFGKHKLMPNVSPAKTIEGLVGGLLASLLVAAGVMYFSAQQETLVVILVTLFTALASAIGDLSESMFKRSANIKDSGTILPGHGGVLDRIDSLTAALPVFTLIYIAFWM
ncbi:phosphatidate cytidylyltransferase [Shewanella sp. NIFS-20-20]|uniref:phosphatidate cytidylyltransferase n=1 Tax=Shewanella sp. NIFS-20-20 TaxID=2853806 RepID=UPI001C465DBB|nr:phosphatidate cytidylyltransferase [Shewanella sp. NIFS-20-20]MBV7316254.1 phosphatidate cytidylyltransferase [Shewanella sp. NIFS-20-20]